MVVSSRKYSTLLTTQTARRALFGQVNFGRSTIGTNGLRSKYFIGQSRYGGWSAHPDSRHAQRTSDQAAFVFPQGEAQSGHRMARRDVIHHRGLGAFKCRRDRDQARISPVPLRIVSESKPNSFLSSCGSPRWTRSSTQVSRGTSTQPARGPSGL